MLYKNEIFCNLNFQVKVYLNLQFSLIHFVLIIKF